MVDDHDAAVGHAVGAEMPGGVDQQGPQGVRLEVAFVDGIVE